MYLHSIVLGGGSGGLEQTGTRNIGKDFIIYVFNIDLPPLAFRNKFHPYDWASPFVGVYMEKF